ncbi:MAG: XisH protein, partial [Merismopedia sp. SIO2A8]|nr:XisH protein [Merismopedia sp. SIO2A8]
MARDAIHEQVKNALVKDGWTITNDPYTLTYEEIEVYADLAAERTLAAEQNGQKIAVEIKSF